MRKGRADMSPEKVDPPAESLWVAEIERRAREVADGRVALVDGDKVHAELSARLRTPSRART